MPFVDWLGSCWRGVYWIVLSCIFGCFLIASLSDISSITCPGASCFLDLLHLLIKKKRAGFMSLKPSRRVCSVNTLSENALYLLGYAYIRQVTWMKYFVGCAILVPLHLWRQWMFLTCSFIWIYIHRLELRCHSFLLFDGICCTLLFFVCLFEFFPSVLPCIPPFI